MGFDFYIHVIYGAEIDSSTFDKLKEKEALKNKDEKENSSSFSSSSSTFELSNEHSFKVTGTEYTVKLYYSDGKTYDRNYNSKDPDLIAISIDEDCLGVREGNKTALEPPSK